MITPTVNGSPVWTKNSLQVGGRNYLLNSTTFLNWKLGHWTLSDETFRGGAVIKTSYTHGIEDGVIGYLSESGKKVLTSFWAKCDVEGASIHYELFGGSASTNFSLETEWKYFVCPQGLVQEDNPQVYFWSNTDGAQISLALPQTEIGSTPSDHSLAPEDTQAQIDEINKKLAALTAPQA
ncbi:hypothetical protein [Lacticaseibacillus sp. N501-2]|uniref:hypothetical protein n=1 Tax=Lacticaseibacillus salsurae TaxID=3367729 RepID=UPI0038B3E13B